jgi:hypothetical protein
LPGFHECIPYDEMNFYLSGLELVANTLLPQKWGFYGQGYHCIGVDLNKQDLIINNQPVWIQHRCLFTYGSVHSGNPGGEL